MRRRRGYRKSWGRRCRCWWHLDPTDGATFFFGCVWIRWRLLLSRRHGCCKGNVFCRSRNPVMRVRPLRSKPPMHTSSQRCECRATVASGTCGIRDSLVFRMMVYALLSAFGIVLEFVKMDGPLVTPDTYLRLVWPKCDTVYNGLIRTSSKLFQLLRCNPIPDTDKSPFRRRGCHIAPRWGER